jgi:hexaprenyl-diphosphate synthase
MPCINQQRKVAVRSNDGTTCSFHRLFSSYSSIPVMMNDVNGHHHGHCKQNSDNQDINTPTIAFEDPVQELLLADTEEPRYWPNLPPTVQPLSTANDPFVLTRSEMDDLSRSIREDLIGVDHPVLHKAAAYFFDTTTNNTTGMTIRPMMVMMLISRALSDAAGASSSSSVSGTSISSSSSSSVFGHVHDWQRPDLPAAQRRLAELSEMIHAGTLFHDDVTNDDDPGNETQQHQISGMMSSFGNKTAILAGDYFLARSSLSLARLQNTQVSEIMSTSIEHLARGQVMQIDRRTSISTTLNDGDNVNDPNTQRLLYYLNMVFYKSASLMAQTCRSAALLGDYSDDLVDASYRYGKHMGMAAHLVGDIAACLDAGRQGLHMTGRPLSIDVLFSALELPQAWDPLLDRKFAKPGDVQEAMALLSSSSTRGVDRAKRLAHAHAEKAVEAALNISSSSTENSDISVYRDALVHLAYQVASRTI